MLIERVDSFVRGFPKATIALVLAATIFFAACMPIFGMEENFDEDSFLPDIEIAKADNRISDDFTTSYSVMVLVRSPEEDGSILTTDAMVEMLELKRAIVNNSDIRPYLQDPENPLSEDNCMTPAEILLQAVVMYGGLQMFNQDMADGIDMLSGMARDLNESISDGSNMTVIRQRVDALTGALGAMQDQSSGGMGDVNMSEFEMFFSGEEVPYDAKIDFFDSKLADLGSLFAGDMAGEGGEPMDMSEMDDLILKYVINGLLTYDTDMLDDISRDAKRVAGYLTSVNMALSSRELSPEDAAWFSATFPVLNATAVEMMGTSLQANGLGFGAQMLGPGIKYSFTKDFKPESDFFLLSGKAEGTLFQVQYNPFMFDERGNSVVEDSPITNKEELEFKMADIIDEEDTRKTVNTPLSGAVMNREIFGGMMDSMYIILGLAVVAIIVILAVVYRNIFDLFISLFALTFAIIWAFGFAALMGFSFNPIILAVPVLLVGLGIDYGIHLTLRYREEIKDGHKISKAVSISIMSVGVALLLATFTTMVAFLSNLTSPLGLLQEFGILAAVGILGSFITMVTFVPAAKMLRDRRRMQYGKPLFRGWDRREKEDGERSAGKKLMNGWLGAGAVMAEKAPALVVIVTVLLSVGGTYYSTKLSTTFDMADFIPEENEFAQELFFTMEEFEIPGGSKETVNILIEGDLSDPDLLRDLHRVESDLDGVPYKLESEELPGEADHSSILTYMFIENRNAQMSMADPRATVDNTTVEYVGLYGTLFEDRAPATDTTREDIEDIFGLLMRMDTNGTKALLHVDEDGHYDAAVLKLGMNTGGDREKTYEVLDALEDAKTPLDGNDQVDRAVITSGPILQNIILDTLNASQVRSLIVTVIISLIVLTIVYYRERKSLILGTITTAPIVLCVSWILGTMYMMDIPLNVMTVVVASLTVGLGITYGIHITHRFLEDIDVKPNAFEAAYATVTHTGGALFGAAITTVAGFGLLVFSLLPPLQQFGLITALTIIYSFLICVFVIPTFLVIWAKYQAKRGRLQFGSKRKAPDTEPVGTVDNTGDSSKVPAKKSGNGKDGKVGKRKAGKIENGNTGKKGKKRAKRPSS